MIFPFPFSALKVSLGQLGFLNRTSWPSFQHTEPRLVFHLQFHRRHIWHTQCWTRQPIHQQRLIVFILQNFTQPLTFPPPYIRRSSFQIFTTNGTTMERIHEILQGSSASQALPATEFDDKYTCSICYRDYNSGNGPETGVTLSCGHTIGSAWIHKWLSVKSRLNGLSHLPRRILPSTPINIAAEPRRAYTGDQLSESTPPRSYKGEESGTRISSASATRGC